MEKYTLFIIQKIAQNQRSLFPNSLINLSRIFQNREKAKTIIWEKDGEEVTK